MAKYSIIDTWVETVSISDSPRTKENYKYQMQQFCNFIERTPEEIVQDYRNRKTMIERDNFKAEYGQMIRAWFTHLQRKGYARNTLEVSVGVVSSFFKHNDLPLVNTPKIRAYTEFHNRDIERWEIQKILEVSNPRNKAAYALMAQSGLRPHTLIQLQIEDFEDILSEKPTIPQKIEVPQSKSKGEFKPYFTFCGPEAVKYIKSYLNTRTELNPKSYLFTKFGHEDEPLSRSVLSVTFKKTVEQLKAKGILDFEIRKGKPSEIHLYNLRKFFRKYAGNAGLDFVHYWLGHVLKNQDEHYFSQNVEHHRKRYKEKAMPHLRIIEPTPTESEKRIKEQQKRIEKQQKQIDELRTKIGQLGDAYQSYQKEKWKTLRLADNKDPSEAISEILKRYGLDRKFHGLKNQVEEQQRQIDEQRELLENIAKETDKFLAAAGIIKKVVLQGKGEYIEEAIREVYRDPDTLPEVKEALKKTMEKIDRKQEEEHKEKT